MVVRRSGNAPLSVAYRATALLLSYRRKEWWPRTDSHRQPPDPKSGALLIALRGSWKVEGGTGLWPVFKVAEARGPAPHAPKGTFRLRNGPGTLVRLNFQKTGAGSRICTEVCLFTRQVHHCSAKPACEKVESGGSQWSRSTTRIAAGPSGFQPAAARSSALTSKCGGPGRICAVNLPVQSRALCCLSYGAVWLRQPDLHRPSVVSYDVASLPALWRNEKWSGTSVLPRVSPRPERGGLLSSSCPMKRWSHGELHPDPRIASAPSCY
jgi:hypothetical protein